MLNFELLYRLIQEEPWIVPFWDDLMKSDYFRAFVVGRLGDMTTRLQKKARKEMPQRNRAQKDAFEAYMKRLGTEWWEVVREMGLIQHPGYAKHREYPSGNVIPGQGVCDHELCPTKRCYQKYGRTEIMSKPKTEEQAKLERTTLLARMLFLTNGSIHAKSQHMSMAQYKAIEFLVKAEGSAIVNGKRCVHIEKEAFVTKDQTQK